MDTQIFSHVASRIKVPLCVKLRTVVFSLAAVFIVLPFNSDAQMVHIDIPMQSLSKSLMQLGEQTSLRIIFAEDTVAGYNASAVSGQLDAEKALAQLLSDTDIVYARNGNTVSLSRGAQSDPVQLSTITVTGGILGDLSSAFSGGQTATGGSLGLLGAQDVMDTPFSTINYTSELLYDQQARTLADVVVNDAAVRTTTSTGGFGEDFVIRGFALGSGDVSVNGLYGLVSASRVPVQILERVEVLKGPGTLMRGIAPGGSVGGAINVVTKRAEDDPLTRVTASYVSQSNFTGQLDLGRRFGDENAWGVRFNGVLRDGEATTSKGKQNLGMAALGADYRGTRMRWSADVIHQEDSLENIRSQIGFQSHLTELPEPPDGRTNFYPGTRLTQRDNTIMSRLEYDFTDSVTGHIGVGYRYGKNRQIFPLNVAPGKPTVRQSVDADGNFSVISTYFDSYSKTYSGEAGLAVQFATGIVDHRVAVAFNYMDQESGNAYTPGNKVVDSNIYRPAPMPEGQSHRPEPRKASESNLFSVAIADTLSFMSDRLLLTLGARRQTVDVASYATATGKKTADYRASAVSPMAGLVFKPTENLSLYANFTQGLTRGTIVPETYANRGEILNPYKSKQYEAGVKADWGDVITSVSLWQIARPAGQEGADNVYGYFGEQRNRGVEIVAYGELYKGLRLMASAAFTEGKLTRTQSPAIQGNTAPGVPKHTYNIGLDWDTPWIKDLSLNSRIIYTSSQYLNNLNTLRLPAFTRFDVGARYYTAIAGKEVVLRANIENLANKRYWLASSNFATNGAGRTFMLSASVNF